MIAIDWVSAVILGVAFGLSMVRAIPQYLRHWIFALACFGVAGYRVFTNRVAGINLLFVVLAAAIGFQYLVRAIRTPRNL
jgi:hypothetical protein